MALQVIDLEEFTQESQEIVDLVKSGRNFLLSGGAGSGKTYSLIEIIRTVLEILPLANIACITYTNAAAKEIAERVDHPKLYVSTIHEFLWDNISHYQEELKNILIELINDDEQTRFKNPEDNGELESNYFDELEKGIQYKEFVQLKNGIISHDELLVVAERMFEKHKKLCSIIKNRYPYILVDEYQDTDKTVIQILLNHFKQSDTNCVVGFFGDAMQSIYDGSVGNLDDYKGDNDDQVKEVKKEQNRRNPQLIIDLANHLRSDGLTQHPSEDKTAPNMDEEGQVISGEILFLYSNNEDLNRVRDYLGWDFADAKQTKELNLTHNLIAGKAGFDDLMQTYDGDKIIDFAIRIKKYMLQNESVVDTGNKTFGEVIDELQHGKTGRDLAAVSPTKGMQAYIDEHPNAYQEALQFPYAEITSFYVDKEQLIDDKKDYIDDDGKIASKRDDLIKHLFKIQHNIRLYKENKINEFLRHTDYNIASIEAKNKLKDNIESLVNVGDKTIKDIIKEAEDFGIAKIDDRLTRFMDKKKYLYQRARDIPFTQFQNLYDYLEGYTPFSTQHKTKGTEFSNVLVILDNGNWNNYNFENLFTGEGRETVLSRTQKIFYVCCTRAKERLAVFYHNPPAAVITKAKVWFGENNIVNLDN